MSARPSVGTFRAATYIPKHVQLTSQQLVDVNGTAWGRARLAAHAARCFAISCVARQLNHEGGSKLSNVTQSLYSSTRSDSVGSLPHSNRSGNFPPENFPSAFGSNQVLPIPEANQERLGRIVSSFSSPIRFAFAYGSGVFSQEEAGPEHSTKPAIRDEKTGEKKKMVDLVLAVSHPEHWHGLNRQQFPKHYSLLSRLSGAEFLMGWVQRAGAGLWYHPYVKMEGELVKYGVIDIDALCNDLLDWETLYVSGRMHKPVAMLIADARVRLAQQVNLASALRVSLLLLPTRFTEVELYTRIASLSYTGDFRMSVPGGENANKVRNIVLAQRHEFRRLYAGLMQSLGTVEITEQREDRFAMTQDRSAETRAGYAARLPLKLREKMMDHYADRPDLDEAFLRLSMSKKDPPVTRKPRPLSSAKHLADQKEKGHEVQSLPQEVLDDFWRACVQQKDFEDVLLQQIAKTVKGPAWAQSLKGVYTAGFSRTLRYVAAKVGKWFEGKKKTE
ncbi:unnamed protein product [Parajaminaea phylloscopi]